MDRTWRFLTILGLATHLLVSGSLNEARAAIVNQCNPGWYTQLDTDPATPAPYMNNLDTGYAEFFVTQDPRIMLVLRGSFPLVRFISFQTYTSAAFVPADALYDHEIQMDPGSINPYEPGAPVDGSPRYYTIEIRPNIATLRQQAASSASANVLWMGSDRLQQVIIRFYSPDSEVTVTRRDLPTVYAYYVDTGLPAPCPPFPSPPIPRNGPWPIPPSPEPTITFHQINGSDANMGNSAVVYFGANNVMESGWVAVIRLRAPSFVNTHSGTGFFPDDNTLDVRYWSLCAVDPTDARTFGAMVDYRAHLASDGYATMVVSNSPDMQAVAEQRGQNFVLDRRSSIADSVVFIYRDLLPSETFMPGGEYQSAYIPTGRICSQLEYLANGCDL